MGDKDPGHLPHSDRGGSGASGESGGGVAGLPRTRSGHQLSYDVLHDVLTSGRYRRADDGRYFVLLSLAEAETIRMIMHLRQGQQARAASS